MRSRNASPSPPGLGRAALGVAGRGEQRPGAPSASPSRCQRRRTGGASTVGRGASGAGSSRRSPRRPRPARRRPRTRRARQAGASRAIGEPARRHLEFERWSQPRTARHAGRMSDEQDTRLWHPFADMGAVRSKELVIDRGEDVWVWDADGRPLPRRHREPLVLQRRPRAARDRRRGRRADRPGSRPTRRSATSPTAPALELADAARVAGADGRRARLPRLRRRRRDRHGRQAGPPLLAGDRRAASATRSSCAPTPTTARTATARRWPASRPTARAGGRSSRTSRIVAHDSVDALRDEVERARRRPRRRRLRRAGDRRRRRAPARRRATSRASPSCAARPGSCSSATRHLRLRPARHLVRDRALRRRPDLIIFAKGVTSGYLPLGGVVARGARRRAVLRRRGRPDVPPRRDLRRPRRRAARRRWPTSTCSSATGCSPAARSSRASCSTRCASSRATSSWARCAAAWACSAPSS